MFSNGNGREVSERRFVVHEIDPRILELPATRIIHGHFEDPMGLSVRVINDDRAEYVFKQGRGRTRRVRTHEIPMADAHFLFRAMGHCVTSKLRRHAVDWKVDCYEGVMSGLIIAEVAAPTDADVALPPWIIKAVEVTDMFTSLHVGRRARDLHGIPDRRPIHEYFARDVRRIVLTGGPCSGKTSIMEALAKEPAFRDRVQFGIEVATVIIGQVGAQPPFFDRVANRGYQRNVYQVQRRFEEFSNLQAQFDGRRAVLLDRGTLDGAAYLHDGRAEFEHVCRTAAQEELGRVYGVIHLGMPPRQVFEAKRGNNATRRESYEEASALDDRIRECWAGHERHVNIASRPTVEEKIAAVRQALELLLA